MRQNALEWAKNGKPERKYDSTPPIIYDCRPPMIFDCRFATKRRMGIGDQICLLSAIQTVAEKTGGGVSIVYDPDYPCSEDVFAMSGLPISTREPSAACNVIECRHHIFEAPNGGDCSLHAEHTGCPVSQVFFNLGWHGLFPSNAIRLRLMPGATATAKAREITERFAGGVCTCTPIEVSRGNDHCNAALYANMLSRFIPANTHVLFGCAYSELKQLREMIAVMQPQHKYTIVTESLPVWRAIIDAATTNVTGNSAGMWLGVASPTHTYLLQYAEVGHRHNQMWNCKPEWECGQIEIIDTITMCHTRNCDA